MTGREVGALVGMGIVALVTVCGLIASLIDEWLERRRDQRDGRGCDA